MRFLDDARKEYLGAFHHYLAIDYELGEDFAHAVDERLERAIAVPGAGRVEPRAPKRLDLRWYTLRRFPYSFLIGTLQGERVVVALAHQKRRPGYWRERLTK